VKLFHSLTLTDSLQEPLKNNFKINKSRIMATYNVTATREIAGKITKGLSVQIAKSLNKPNLNEIMKAFEKQHDITIKSSVVITYFNIEEVK
jgi:hypothetical protein